MSDLSLFIFISLGLLAIGMIGLLTKRNALIFFLSIELILNGANLLFVAFAREWMNEVGLIWSFFVLVVAAVEAAVGLVLLIHLFREKPQVDVDQYDLLKG